MALPNLLMWAAATIAAIWKLSQLIRAPHDRGLRVVTMCTVLVLVALSAQLAVSIPPVAEFFPSQSPKLIQNVILTFFFALLLVLLHSSVAPSAVGSRGWLEVMFALVASGGLVAAFAAAAPDNRGASYEHAGDSPAVLAFYLIGNLYMSYATARGAYLAWTTADHTRSRARLSLRVAAAGLAVNCLGTHTPRVLSTAGRLVSGKDPIPGTATWTTPILAIGIVAFFLGIGYPGVRTGLVKARMWIEVRRHYRQLRPLWAALCAQFDNIALFPQVSPLREALQLRQMRLRYYRRVIECRDGLVCLSPFVAEPVDSSKTPEQQAEIVRDALARAAAGEQVSVTSVLAAPEAAGMDADSQQLLALSRAFGRLDSTDARPVSGTTSPTN
ncbi:MAB_1171c family putative transporter [Saccharopolyspora tripterygii]